ncbi:hypothetical protein H920_10380 [Fukomys damarensis]|uniref:Uncharacterized protein n=1 Tax=Fukomys damarensis TaxID=885580 RepID=A0A091DCP6_FUKDA|nr:hypothetical protein H920_10380 [Fukomys damarensis]
MQLSFYLPLQEPKDSKCVPGNIQDFLVPITGILLTSKRRGSGKDIAAQKTQLEMDLS